MDPEVVDVTFSLESQCAPFPLFPVYRGPCKDCMDPILSRVLAATRYGIGDKMTFVEYNSQIFTELEC
jgi:hypothetical protein